MNGNWNYIVMAKIIYLDSFSLSSFKEKSVPLRTEFTIIVLAQHLREYKLNPISIYTSAIVNSGIRPWLREGRRQNHSSLKYALHEYIGTRIFF